MKLTKRERDELRALIIAGLSTSALGEDAINREADRLLKDAEKQIGKALGSDADAVQKQMILDTYRRALPARAEERARALERQPQAQQNAVRDLAKAAESGDPRKVEKATKAAEAAEVGEDSIGAILSQIQGQNAIAMSDQVDSNARVKGSSGLFGGKASNSPYYVDKDGNEVPLQVNENGKIIGDKQGVVMRDMTRAEVRQAFLDASPEQRSRIQQDMYEAGLYGESVPIPGVVGRADIAAFDEMIDASVRNKVPLDKLMRDTKERARVFNSNARGVLASSKNPARQFTPDPITVTNEGTVRASAEQAFVQTLGRKPTEQELSTFVASYRQQEIAEQEQMQAYARQVFDSRQQQELAFERQQERLADPFSPMNQPAKGAAGQALQRAAAQPIQQTADAVTPGGALTAPVIERPMNPGDAAALAARQANPQEALANDWLVRAQMMFQGLGSPVSVSPVEL